MDLFSVKEEQGMLSNWETRSLGGEGVSRSLLWGSPESRGRGGDWSRKLVAHIFSGPHGA